ncbi:putative F-box protein At5g38390 [Neltuma alba]|uniref:putative F-box protein At5g38390 n=1 Tax=Neltuma alba TaxID=207710 RepID=UPI0010A424AC|nr:putative F-box protein At5g38390 [Prosopis alba]
MEEVEAGYSLSNLPDEILHRIFSFLGIRNIARLSVLSRRFQTLCTTAPSFFFSEPDLNPRVRNCACPHVFNFMNTLLQRRPPHALNINQLCFSSFCKIPQHRSLHDEWINKLFRTFHVDELYLYYQLPSIFGSLPRFQSLKVLKLNMRGLAWVKLPEMMKIASLETLHMRFIKTEDSVGEWVSESFPSLKTLFLCSITARASAKQLELAIGSSCLEDLTIQYCCNFKAVRIITENLRALSYKVDDEIVVEISAPNLQRVSWRGALPRLRYDARRTFKSLDVAVMTHLKFRNLNLLIQLFEAMRWAKLQHMDTYMLKVSS